ncbi:MAG: hypothetical protein R3Y12_04305 [Clostridia bacterium]
MFDSRFLTGYLTGCSTILLMKISYECGKNYAIEQMSKMDTTVDNIEETQNKN